MVAVARVIRPWGSHGELRVIVLSESLDRFSAYRTVYIRGRSHKVQRLRAQGRFVTAKLSGIDNSDAANTFRGCLLEVPESSLAALPEDHYYHYQIIGLKVITTRGTDVGEIVDILTTGANDVYIIKSEQAEILIPAIADVIQNVDLEKGVVIIEPLEGE